MKVPQFHIPFIRIWTTSRDYLQYMGLSDFKIPLKYFKVPLRSTFDIFKGYLAPKTVPGPPSKTGMATPKGTIGSSATSTSATCGGGCVANEDTRPSPS